MKNIPVSTSRVKMIKIKENDVIYAYCETMCSNAKLLYNGINYYCRQVYFYCDKKKKSETVSKKTKEAYYQVIDTLKDINLLREKYNAEHSDKKQKLIFEYPDTGRWFLRYELLDALAKILCKDLYYSLPSNASQKVMSNLAEAWKSYMVKLSKKKKGENEEDKPRPVGYTQDSRRTLKCTTNVAKFKLDEKGNRFLQFAKIPESGMKECPRFYHSWFNEIPDGWKHQETRIKPSVKGFVIELVFSISFENAVDEDSYEPVRVIGLDPGVNYFIAVANNFGARPVIINGKPINNLNNFWNHEMEYLQEIHTHGHDPKEKGYSRSTKRMKLATNKRNARVDDYIHKVSRWVVNYCLENHVDTIVVGKNPGWKQNVHMGRKGNRKFVQVPHARFIDKLKYKAYEKGIVVIEQQESYTSKSSFLDLDPIPDYKKETAGKLDHLFSGKRGSSKQTRRTYKASDGTKIHADVNGALNIIRKAFPDMSVDDAWRSVALLSPVKINIS